ncbi:MAG TPA: hypothetical protein VGA73_03155 [Candidatus Binatia bacterium]
MKTLCHPPLRPPWIVALALLGAIFFSPAARPEAALRYPGSEELKRRAEEAGKAAGTIQPAPRQEGAPAAPLPRSVAVESGFEGMAFSTSGGATPPDTHAATGADHIVEIVNSSLAIYNRATGALISQQSLADFFAAVKISDCIVEVAVGYDELARRFIVGALDIPERCGLDPPERTGLLYAVSDAADPTAGFSEMHSIDMDEPGKFNCAGERVGGDFNKVGWNADAHVFTINMYNFSETCFDHVAIVTIDKSTVLDADPTTLSFFHNDRSGFGHFTMVPAAMHGSVTGDPLWFVEEAGFANGKMIRVVKMTNPLSAAPVFADKDVTVAAYGLPPSATQSGSPTLINTLDSRILSVDWRSDRLLAAHNVGRSGAAHARWYEFNTFGASPSLAQQGGIEPGAAVHTYYPSVAISGSGAVGMTFLQSSDAEFMSMYVTGRLLSDPSGAMQTPALAKAGAGVYQPLDCVSPCRAGDYSGVTADPNFTNRFCAANEYAPADGVNDWKTWIACFTMAPNDTSVHELAVAGIAAPKSVKKSGATLPVAVVVQNRGDHSETIPNASFLGDGKTTGMVRLGVEVVDSDDEACAPAVVALNGAKNAALFKKGPKVLAPGASLTVNFLVTYRCASARPRNKSAPDAGDYSHVATVHHEALDEIADGAPADDTCPQGAAGAVKKSALSSCASPVVVDVAF